MNGDPIVKEANAPAKAVAKPKTTQPKAVKPKINETLSMDASPVKKTQEKAKEKAKEKVKEKEKKEKIKKIRTLCKLVKRDFLKKNFKEYQELVTDPHFICRKCGRVAKEKQYLCKPVLILMEVKEKDSITLQGKEIELLQENEPKLSEEKL